MSTTFKRLSRVLAVTILLIAVAVASSVIGNGEKRPSARAALGDFSVPTPSGASQNRAVSEDSNQNSAPVADAEYVAGEIVVRFRAAASRLERRRALRRIRATSSERLVTRDAVVASLPDDVSVKRAQGLLAGSTAVKYAEPNFTVAVTAVPDDPRFDELWGMNNTGQTGGLAGADINAPEAWDVHTGDGTAVVAVLDTGIDYNHEDLSGNIWTNSGEFGLDAQGNDKRTNGIDDDNNGYDDDWHGYDAVNDDSDPFDGHAHGTHVAGTIGAEGDNGVGVTGVNWWVDLMAVKVLGDSGSGTHTALAQGIEYAADNGADVVNMSLGSTSQSSLLSDAIAAHPEVLFVVAAGNNSADADGGGPGANYPCNYTLANIVCVGASTASDEVASFSNYGTTSVDLAAPGTNILSAKSSAYSGGSGNYVSFQGTSMATPHVAGAAALIKSYDPQISVIGLKSRLLDFAAPAPAWSGKSVTGGRLDLAASLGGTPQPQASRVYRTASKIVFDADVGESNDATIELSGSDFTVTDANNDLNAGVGCTQLSSGSVSCSSTSVTQLVALLDDGDDQFTNLTALDARIEAGAGEDDITGGSGDDTLNPGPGLDADTIAGGDGFDTVDYSDRPEPLNISLNGQTDDGATDEDDSIAADVEGVRGGAGADVIEGSYADNLLVSNGGDDEIDGGDGNDLLEGGSGNDELHGQSGIDTVSFADQPGSDISIDGEDNDGPDGATDLVGLDIENVVGSPEADVIIGSSSDNSIDGGAGDDTIDAGAGNDTVAGGNGADLIGSGDGVDTVDGGDGADQIDAGTGDDTIDGGAGDDAVGGGDGEDNLDGGSGNDSLDGGSDPAVSDSIDGGEGTSDSVSYATRSSAVNVDLSDNDGDGAAGESDSLTGIENAIGGAGDDVLVGDGFPNNLIGGSGNDTLTGGKGSNTYDGGSGEDVVNARNVYPDHVVCGPDADTVSADGYDYDPFYASVNADCETVDYLAMIAASSTHINFVAKPGDADDLTITRSGSTYTFTNNHPFTAGDGCVNVAPASAQCTTGALSIGVRLWDGDDRVDHQTTAVTNLDGGSGNDVLIDHASSSGLIGGDGDDELHAGDGDDRLVGGAGDDWLEPGFGMEASPYSSGFWPGVGGGSGIDVVSYAERSNPVRVTLSDTDATVLSGNDGEVGEYDYVGSDVENVVGGMSDDTLTGNAQPNVIDGGVGNDSVGGGLGSDVLRGGSEDDTALAKDGVTDTVECGDGTDVATTDPTDSPTGCESSGSFALAYISGSTVYYVGGTGESSDVEVSTAGDAIILRDDANAIESGAGCMPIATNIVSCPATGIFSLSADLGDLGDTFTNLTQKVAVVHGGSGDDELVGSTAREAFNGDAGIDTVSYASRESNLTLSINSAVYSGQQGELDIISSDVENLVGGDGNDTFNGSSAANKFQGGDGNDTFNGGSGADTADYGDHSANVTATIDGSANDGAVGETDNVRTDMEAIIGGSGDDLLTGHATQADTLDGGTGTDELFGLGGSDTLIGGLGTDELHGGDGSADIVSYATHTTGVSVDFDGQADDGAPNENDSIGSDIERVTGGPAGDTLSPNPDANGQVLGAGGDDTIIGNAASTTLNGGSGNDTINGGKGQESIHGAEGDDTVSGGPGDDQFVNGGAGNDIVDTLDGIVDEDVVCGTGVDQALLDAGDYGDSACETSEARHVASLFHLEEDDGQGGLVGYLAYSAAPGQSNEVSIERIGDDFVVTDPGVTIYSADGNCVPWVASQLTCSATTSNVQIDVMLDTQDTLDDSLVLPGNAGDYATSTVLAGPGDDSIAGGSGIDLLTAGAGDDTIDSADSVMDTVSCGDGDDDAAVDHLDDFGSDCEQVSGDRPDTVIDAGPDGPSNDSTPTFEFHADPAAAAASFECRLHPAGGSSAWSACSGTTQNGAGSHTADALADGDYTFEVRAVKANGSADLTPAVRSFTVDTQTPGTQITSPTWYQAFASGPVTVTWVNDGSPVEATCAVNGIPVSPCSSPLTIDPGVGIHSVFVSETDAAGNQSSSAMTFTIDGTPPEVDVIAPSGAIAESSPVLEYDAFDNETGVAYPYCTIDGGTAFSCNSGDVLPSLADGPHTITVTVSDFGWNTASATSSFTVDTVAPSAPTISTPVANSFVGVANPTIAGSSEPNAVVKVYDGTVLKCTTTADISGDWSCVASTMSSGTRTLKARATDEAGNVSDYSASVGVIVDTTSPDVVLSGSTVTVTTNSGTVNVINVAKSGSSITFSESSALTLKAGSGCTQVDSKSVSCPEAGLSAISANTMDGNDTFSIDAGVTIGATVNGGSGNDTLNGGTGDDTLIGGSGNDVSSGGAGLDTASYTGHFSEVTASLNGQADDGASGETDNIGPGIENLTGGAGNDVLRGNAGDNRIDGAGASDIASYSDATSGVSVSLALGGSQDTVGAGNDQIVNTESLEGSPFADALTGNANSNALEGMLGDDVLDGAGGIDTVVYSSASAGVTVDLGTVGQQNTGSAGGDTLSGFENLLGSSHDDLLASGASNNSINGLGGVDTISFAAFSGAVTVNLSTNSSSGAAGADFLSGIENVTGGSGNDTLVGNTGDNTIAGGAGVDSVDTGAGNDTVLIRDGLNDGNTVCGSGNDTLFADLIAIGDANTGGDCEVVDRQ